tara:strand:- start:413 stop:703 length:291 start_codon:yes stop_codon:yes gene_type:complete
MSWEDVNKHNSPESKAHAENSTKNQRQKESDLAKAYSRCFSTDNGKAVLADLYSRMVVGNTPDKNEANINYMAAYKNGESGAVSYIQQQIIRAEVI